MDWMFVSRQNSYVEMVTPMSVKAPISEAAPGQGFPGGGGQDLWGLRHQVPKLCHPVLRV